ncbi:hypothetical protein MNBD_GAMMA26-985 [hydrothermal vent metagenome]|uniref:Flagellar protein FliT n=1 Tax=hydrothermal vent metagenome TaxID=652676 RepID=A0A3B1BJ37_9ZZZZ
MTWEDQQLEGVLDQSKKICNLAVAGEWQEVEALEIKRRKSIEACLSVDSVFGDPEKAMRLIQEVMELDKKVMGLGINARDELGGALREFQRGRQAVKAYRMTAS